MRYDTTTGGFTGQQECCNRWGTDLTILLIKSSVITPRPDGILPTRPMADAPKEMAV